MDDAGPLVSINPCRLWSIMQHVFHAAVLLASDFSLYPTSLDATTRQQEVMAACRILEQSASEVDGTQRVVQKLRATLKERKLKNIPPTTINPASLISREHTPGSSATTTVHSPVMQYKVEPSPLSNNSDGISPSPLDKLWSEFVDAAPEMDLDLWTSLLDEIDGTLSAEHPGRLWGGFENSI
jgi:hypothetical protein